MTAAGWIRRLGGKNWRWLHRLIYASALAGVIHYAWLVKADLRKPLQYAAMLAVLMLYRVVVWAAPKLRSARAVALRVES